MSRSNAISWSCSKNLTIFCPFNLITFAFIIYSSNYWDFYIFTTNRNGSIFLLGVFWGEGSAKVLLNGSFFVFSEHCRLCEYLMRIWLGWRKIAQKREWEKGKCWCKWKETLGRPFLHRNTHAADVSWVRFCWWRKLVVVAKREREWLKKTRNERWNKVWCHMANGSGRSFDNYAIRNPLNLPFKCSFAPSSKAKKKHRHNMQLWWPSSRWKIFFSSLSEKCVTSIWWWNFRVATPFFPCLSHLCRLRLCCESLKKLKMFLKIFFFHCRKLFFNTPEASSRFSSFFCLQHNALIR